MTIHLLLTTIFSVSIASCKEDVIKDVNLPLFQDGYEIKQGYLDDLKTKYLNYKLNVKYPANSIIDFHNSFFKKAGFIPYSEDGYGKSIWENFNYKSGDWELTTQPPARYIATWIDKEKKIRVILLLLFKSEENTGDPNSSNQLLIEVKATKFFDFRKIPVPTE